MASGAEGRSNFSLGFVFLPRAKRRALSAVYAYCRLIDDIVDSPDRTQGSARGMLDFWRAEVDRLFEGRPTQPIAQALVRPIADFNIPKEPFLEMIRGCAMDLDGTRYETIEDLESYMRGVASSVGVMCVHIFGWDYTPRERILEFARDFGYAFQLTNIIRDVGADLELGRVYLPRDDLRAAGYGVDRLRARELAPAFERLMDEQYRRAKDYYARARSRIDPRDRRRLLPAEIMAHVYEGLLDEIKEGGFRVFSGRARLSSGRKILLAFRAWLGCHGV